MSIKESIGRIYAWIINCRTNKWLRYPIGTQRAILNDLILKGTETQFGRDHNFSSINSYEDFKKCVPIRDYEGFHSYIELIKEGKTDILWRGRPLYFCKTSGTTSGVKYIPITKDSLTNHINAARNALLNYIYETGNSELINGKMIFIQGSPILQYIKDIPFGRLSGIVAHHVPKYLQKNRMPSYKTNRIEDWESKIDTIVEETKHENMTLIGGIPSWVQMYFEKLQEKSGGKKIKEIFPKLKLLVVGGVNFEPYSNRFNQLIGGNIDFLEIYPASEGFFAYQDKRDDKGLLLLLNEGIFYEFIEMNGNINDDSTRISLEDVKINTNYALVINSNAGLWGYLIGDTIKFTSLKPHRIIVTGRIKHFISAFGEHVISEEVESAIYELMITEKVEVIEFTVAPQVSPPLGELPFHEWYIEFNESLYDIESLSKKLDILIQLKNHQYKDLIEGSVLQTLKIVEIQQNGFKDYMRDKGKLGGQNKMVRLSNDRDIAGELKKYVII